MTDITLTEDKIEQIKAICKEFNNKKTDIIHVLHRVQNTFGYLPPSVQKLIAQELDLSVAHVYGIVTFYSYFKMMPVGEHPISVCIGTACHVRGAEKVLEEFKKILKIEVGETTPDGKFSLNCLRCVGACGLAPVVLVGERVYGRLTPKQVKEILDEYK